MKLYTFCEKHGLDLELHRYSKQEGRWTANISGAEFKDSKEHIMLTGTYGNGTSPEEAIASFVSQIKDKFMVMFAYSSQRFELKVPKNLTA